MHNQKEEILETVFRPLRFKHSLSHFPNRNLGVVVDIGCGLRDYFPAFMVKHGYTIDAYTGIDPLLHPQIQSMKHTVPSSTFIQSPIEEKLSFEDDSVDHVVGFAVLEHVDHPKMIVQEVIRILKPGGRAVFSAPTTRAKAILEFLAFKLKLVSPRSITEHKQYFEKDTMSALIPLTDKDTVTIHHDYFEFGMNNLLVLNKKINPS